MTRTVWVYPEREFRPLGAVRFRLSWEEVKPSAIGKDDIDHDLDISHLYLTFATKDAAMKKGAEIVQSGRTAYGQGTVQEQRVDWFVEEDRVAEWMDVGEPEYVD